MLNHCKSISASLMLICTLLHQQVLACNSPIALCSFQMSLGHSEQVPYGAMSHYLVVISEPIGCLVNKFSWLLSWGLLIHLFSQHSFWAAVRWYWGYIGSAYIGSCSMTLFKTNMISLICFKSWTDGKNSAASSGCSSTHNDSEKYQGNKIKGRSSNVIYSIQSLWGYSSKSSFSFSFKVVCWTTSIVLLIVLWIVLWIFSFLKFSLEICPA